MGFRVFDLGFSVFGFRVQGLGLGFGGLGVGFRVQGLEGLGLGFRIQGLAKPNEGLECTCHWLCAGDPHPEAITP